MTDENKFFRYLWRFNALLLAGCGIAAIIAIAVGLLVERRSAGPPPQGGFTPVPKAAEKGFTFRLEDYGVHRLIGGEEIIALDRWNGAPATYGLQQLRASSRFASSQSVNLLAIEQNTASSHWLFRGYSRSIIGDNSIYSPDQMGLIQDTRPAIALVMTVVDADTNKDGELSEKDRQSLYVYRAGMQEATRLLTADLIISVQQLGAGHYVVLYENGKSAVAATYSVPDFKLISQKPLPDVPQ